MEAIDLKLDKPTYRINEALKVLPIGRSKLYEEIRSKRIRVTYLGSIPFFLAPDLADYLLRLRAESRS